MASTERITPDYIAMNRALHANRKTYGASGHRWADKIRHMRDASILDYGCGKGTLKTALGWDISEYDPAIPGKDADPHPHDCVVCTDVLEHIEPECLDNVLKHIASLMRVSGLLVVATRAANKSLPDGRNAHLIIEPWEWWEERIKRHFKVRKIEKDVTQPGEFAVWVEPLS